MLVIDFCFADGSGVESTPFLAKPVQLTPAWEANNLPNDELNLKGICFWLFDRYSFFFLFIFFPFIYKGMTMDRAKMEINPPRDRYNLIFMTLLLHGVGTLMPWNMFITAKDVIDCVCEIKLNLL